MSGALGYVDIETAVSDTISGLESWLAEELGQDEVSWKVAFNESGTLAIPDPDSEMIEVTVTAQLQDQIPQRHSTDQGFVPSPIFPINRSLDREQIKPEETEGYEEVLSRDVLDIRSLADVSASTEEELKRVVRQEDSSVVVDAFGTAWSDLNSSLAARAAEISLSVEEPDIVVSFDVLETLMFVFQYEDFLKYEQREDGEVVAEDDIEFKRIVEGESVSPDQIPIVDKIYVHQNKRVAASDYEISHQDIVDALRGRVVEWNELCTVPDPSGKGVRARIGSISKIEIPEGESDYRGFVRAAEDVDVSRLYDFYAALDVPKAPYITAELSQETSEWDSDHDSFSGWSAADNGFVYHSIDKRRDIQRRLYAHHYWVIHGEKYRKKDDFERDIETLIGFIESELECEVSWREFSGVRISKTPIQQSDVLTQIQNEVQAPPDQEHLMQALGTFRGDSEEIEGINQPLFASDLSEFVADTSIIDAQVVTRLVSDGDLYQSKILVPSVVVEEVHRQIENGEPYGERGLEELTALRELSEAGIIDLEVVEVGKKVDTTDNVAVDQSILSVAKENDVPLCSSDKTLLELAEVSGVTAYPLDQELSRWPHLIINTLQKRGELRLTDLVRVVYEQVEETKFSEETLHREMFQTPSSRPSQDVAKEMEIKEEIERLQRRGEIYIREERVGLVEDIAIIPSVQTIQDSYLSDSIREDTISEQISIPAYKTNIAVVLPSSIKKWASVQSDSTYLDEIQQLEDLAQRNLIEVRWESYLSSDASIALVNEEQLSNLLQSVHQRIREEFVHTFEADVVDGRLSLI